jgi:LuxR family maltose regulon positive regulatory protein
MVSFSDHRFSAPFLPPKHLSRPRLLERIDKAESTPLTVLSAGAGAGKTLLLTEWARLQDAPVPWLALTPSDDDPVRFWRVFLEAVQAAGQVQVPAPAAHGRVDDLLDLVLSRPPGTARRSAIVLDDAHVLTRPEILDGLDRIIRRWSHRIRLVVAARSDPLLPLHRYRLADQMRELRATDLAMTQNEAGQLLRIHGVRLAEDDVRSLTARTEGWSAGLRLAALRMESHERPEEFVALLAMDEGSIGEYLTEEVLAVLPQHVQRLLIETSFLEDVSGPLADAVTGMDGCHSLLIDLARSNSFVVPGDAALTTFRYHQLFREMLRHLARGQSAQAQRRQYLGAADWYRRQGDMGNALRWSMRADDGELARWVLAHGGLAQLYVGRHDQHDAALLRLSQQPRPDDGSPALQAQFDVTQRAVLAALAGPAEAAHLAAAPVPEADLPGDDPELELTALLAEMLVSEKAGRFPELDALAQRVLSEERFQATLDTRPGLRPRVLLARAQALCGVGHLTEQGQVLRRALDGARADDLVALEIEALSMLAFVEVCTCRLRHARTTIDDAETLLARHTQVHRPVFLDLAIARRAYVMADFAAMAAALRRGAVGSTGHAAVAMAAGIAFLQVTLLVSLGEYGRARAILREDPALARTAVGLFAVALDRELATIEIAQGRPRSALQILGRHRSDAAALAVEITVARAHLALGDLDRATASVRAVTTTPSPFADRPLIVEATLCEAEIAERRGDEGRAAEALDRALLIADGEIVLPFVQAADALDAVLARHHGLAARWPTGPVSAAPPPALPPRQPLPDALTHREEAVLRLMTTSMSTAEIAEELCLSVNTIKTHLAAIYRKLAVGRRREAVFRARELELI